eukprot:PhF_6_TR36055/c0_g1_i4/m.52324
MDELLQYLDQSDPALDTSLEIANAIRPPPVALPIARGQAIPSYKKAIKDGGIPHNITPDLTRRHHTTTKSNILRHQHHDDSYDGDDSVHRFGEGGGEPTATTVNVSIADTSFAMTADPNNNHHQFLMPRSDDDTASLTSQSVSVIPPPRQPSKHKTNASRNITKAIDRIREMQNHLDRVLYEIDREDIQRQLIIPNQENIMQSAANVEGAQVMSQKSSSLTGASTAHTHVFQTALSPPRQDAIPRKKTTNRQI